MQKIEGRGGKKRSNRCIKAAMRRKRRTNNHRTTTLATSSHRAAIKRKKPEKKKSKRPQKVRRRKEEEERDGLVGGGEGRVDSGLLPFWCDDFNHGTDRRDQIHRGELGLTSKKLSGTSITDAHRLHQLLIESNIEKVSGLQCNFMFNDSTQLLISDHSGPVICRTDRLYFLPAIAIRNRHAIEKGGDSSSPRQATRHCSLRKGSSGFWQWRANRGLLPAVITCLSPSEQETRKLPERPGKSSETQTSCTMLAGGREGQTKGISAYKKWAEFGWINQGLAE